MVNTRSGRGMRRVDALKGPVGMLMAAFLVIAVLMDLTGWTVGGSTVSGLAIPSTAGAANARRLLGTEVSSATSNSSVCGCTLSRCCKNSSFTGFCGKAAASKEACASGQPLGGCFLENTTIVPVDATNSSEEEGPGVWCCNGLADCPDGYFCSDGVCKMWDPEVELSCSMEPGGTYPADAFTCKQKKEGAVILHAVGVFWMFLGLAIICDDYFVPALEVLVERWELKEDVAGATFMAAGGSAPELFTSIVGVFLAGNDVGFGTIVGSAVFNVLLVIGACAMAAGEPLALTWFPLARDSVYYSISIIVLYVLVVNDNWVKEEHLTEADKVKQLSGQIVVRDGYAEMTVIVWWEALIMLLLYVGYVVIMKYNEQLETWAKARFSGQKGRVKSPAAAAPKETPKEAPKKAANPSDVDIEMASTEESPARKEEQGTGGEGRRPSLGLAGTVYASQLSRLGQSGAGASGGGGGMSLALKRFQLASKVVVEQQREVKRALSRRALRRLATESEGTASKQNSEADDGGQDGEEDSDPFMPPWRADPAPELNLKLAWAVIWWLYKLPLYVFFMWIPDARIEEKKKYYEFTFLGSILVIAVLSFFMVWWMTEICEAAGIPVPVAGLTFLAAGTSVPDLLSSVFVAQRGFGDMAVSSSIGSNIFDLCMGLPLPWLIMTWIVGPARDGNFGNSYVYIGSKGITFSLLLLFGMLLVTISWYKALLYYKFNRSWPADAVACSIVFFKWEISKPMGYTMFVLYIVFVLLSLLAEYGVINPEFSAPFDPCSVAGAGCMGNV